MTRSEAEAVVNKLLFLDMLPGCDSLGVAIATFYEGHPERPDDDPEDDETGWGEWTDKQFERFENDMVDILTADTTKKDID
jgi:hypothetical protein